MGRKPLIIDNDAAIKIPAPYDLDMRFQNDAAVHYHIGNGYMGDGSV